MVWLLSKLFGSKLIVSKCKTKLLVKSYSMCGATENPIVTVKHGKLKGVTQKLFDRSPYYSFKGIPYAEPPVGKLRFKDPLPLKPWKGTYEAINHGPICPQIEMTKMKTDIEDENCLFLNVYSKSLDCHSRLPVMVYIYGGAYMSGSGNATAYGPEFLLQHDVVLVTFNYRVETLGFLCLDTPEVPGNAGMKDQVAVLRWVRDNISQFGGNPDDVTLFGESAGGANVSYHLLSPMSNGLFHKAIIQSGACISDWAQGKGGKDRALRLGKFLENDTNNLTKLLDFLQSVPIKALTSRVTVKTSTDDEKVRGLPIRFCPVVENRFDGVESFINEEPLKLLVQKKVNKIPTVIGYTSMEGLFFAPYQIKLKDVINKNPQFIVPREVAEKVSEKHMIELGHRIQKFYVGDRDYNEQDFLKIAEREMDIQVAHSIHRFSHFYAMLNPQIYMYVFDCDTLLNFAKKINKCTSFEGANHADDLYYLFSHVGTIDIYKQHKNLRYLVYNITKIWTDFAKSGNPTPDKNYSTIWKPYSNTCKQYALIENEGLTMKQYAHRNRIEFWNKLYAEVGLPSDCKSSL